MGEHDKRTSEKENRWRFLTALRLSLRAVSRAEPALGMTPFVRWALSMAAAGALVLTVAASSRAQSADVQPAALSKQRAALYLQGTRAPLANLESDLNHLAILSETCRVKYGSQACGLPEKPLESDKLEDRYAYYVRQPVEAHTKAQGVKISRRNWAGSSAK